jgi:hypothetical protein
MINLLNKILSRFNLKLINIKPVRLVDEAVKFLDTIPKDSLLDVDISCYVGDINYVVVLLPKDDKE